MAITLNIHGAKQILQAHHDEKEKKQKNSTPIQKCGENLQALQASKETQGDALLTKIVKRVQQRDEADQCEGAFDDIAMEIGASATVLKDLKAKYKALSGTESPTYNPNELQLVFKKAVASSKSSASSSTSGLKAPQCTRYLNRFSKHLGKLTQDVGSLRCGRACWSSSDPTKGDLEWTPLLTLINYRYYLQSWDNYGDSWLNNILPNYPDEPEEESRSHRRIHLRKACNMEFIQMLLEHGADVGHVCRTTEHRETPFLASVLVPGEMDMLEKIIAYASPYTIRTQCVPALIAVSKNAAPKTVKFLLSLGANPLAYPEPDCNFRPFDCHRYTFAAEMVTKHGQPAASAIHIVIKNRQTEMFEVLLKKCPAWLLDAPIDSGGGTLFTTCMGVHNLPAMLPLLLKDERAKTWIDFSCSTPAIWQALVDSCKAAFNKSDQEKVCASCNVMALVPYFNEKQLRQIAADSVMLQCVAWSFSVDRLRQLLGYLKDSEEGDSSSQLNTAKAARTLIFDVIHAYAFYCTHARDWEALQADDNETCAMRLQTIIAELLSLGLDVNDTSKNIESPSEKDDIVGFAVSKMCGTLVLDRFLESGHVFSKKRSTKLLGKLLAQTYVSGQTSQEMYLQQATWLFAHGADADGIAESGGTLFMRAAQHRSGSARVQELLELFLTQGADSRIMCRSHGGTVYHWLVRSNNANTAVLDMMKQKDVHEGWQYCDKEGQSLLLSAIARDAQDAVTWCVKNGMSPAERNKNNLNAFDVAVAQSGLGSNASAKHGLVRCLVDGCDQAKTIGSSDSFILHTDGFAFNGPGFSMDDVEDDVDYAQEHNEEDEHSSIFLCVDFDDLIATSLECLWLDSLRNREEGISDKYINVKYRGMAGDDDSGLARDYVTRIATALGDANLGLLDACEVDGTFYHTPRPSVEEDKEEGQKMRWLLGVVIGWSLLFHVPIAINPSPAFCRYLLSMGVCSSDLAYIEGMVPNYEMLSKIAAMPESQRQQELDMIEMVIDAPLTFVTESRALQEAIFKRSSANFAEREQSGLDEDAGRRVTPASVPEYIEKLAAKRLGTNIAMELEQIKLGFDLALGLNKEHHEELREFCEEHIPDAPFKLGRLIAGDTDFDLAAWKEATCCSDDCCAVRVVGVAGRLCRAAQLSGLQFFSFFLVPR